MSSPRLYSKRLQPSARAFSSIPSTGRPRESVPPTQYGVGSCARMMNASSCGRSASCTVANRFVTVSDTRTPLFSQIDSSSCTPTISLSHSEVSRLSSFAWPRWNMSKQPTVRQHVPFDAAPRPSAKFFQLPYRERSPSSSLPARNDGQLPDDGMRGSARSTSLSSVDGVSTTCGSSGVDEQARTIASRLRSVDSLLPLNFEGLRALSAPGPPTFPTFSTTDTIFRRRGSPPPALPPASAGSRPPARPPPAAAAPPAPGPTCGRRSRS